jgi:glycopeptide antibiotics resistance protein
VSHSDLPPNSGERKRRNLPALLGSRGGRRWAWLLAGVVAVWLLWMTLRPGPTVANDLAPLTRSAATRLIPVHVLIDLLGNVAVFVPLGLAVALALGPRPLGQRLLWATLAGAGLSLAIELIQATLPSRVSAVDDWLLNTIGTALGALAGCWIGKAGTR